jgi:hypothetical protein
MAGLDDILKMLPIDQIAAKLGVDPATAAQAVQEGGGAILSGLQQNASTPEGASAIEAALGRHTGIADRVDLDQVDTADGGKILQHVFGGKQQDVARALTDEPKTAGIDFGALLPMLAPIVMGLVAKNKAGAPTQPAAPSASTGGIGDLLGGLLGGGSGGSTASAGGFDISSVLGGLLGGRK